MRSRRAVRAALAVVGAGAVLVAIVAGVARLHVDTTVSSFLPSHDTSITTWTNEQNAFGGDPIAVLLASKQPRQLLSGTPLIDEVRLEGELSDLPHVAVVYGPGTTLNEVALSLQDVIVDIAGKRQALEDQAESAAKKKGESKAAQASAGQAAVYQFDNRYGSLLSKGLAVGLPTLANPSFDKAVFFGSGTTSRAAFRWLVPDADHEAILIRPATNLGQDQTIALVRSVRHLVATSGLPLASYSVTGTPVVAAALGQEVVAELPVLGALAVGAVAVCFLLTRRRYRRWQRALPLAIDLVATGATMAIFGWLGLPLSVGLLAFMPIILGVGTDYPIYALSNGRPRLILATVAASAAGLAVLAISPLPFVRDLGIALATGLIISAGLGLLVARWLQPVEPAPRPARPPGWARRSVRRLLATRRRRLGAGAVAGVAAVAGWALFGTLALNSNPESLAAGLPAVTQAVKAESVLGASGELDVYVRAPDVMTPAFLAWYDKAEARLVADHPTQLDPVISPAGIFGWLGAHPTPSEISSAQALLPAYLTTATVADGQRQAVMAFGVKLDSLGTEERLVSAIKAELPPPPAGSTVAVTGLPAVAARSYVLLSGDRVLTNVAGIVVFGLVLGLLLRRRRDALLAVAAAVLATGWGFLLLKVTGTALTPLTVSLGTLTSAVGGEFTVMALDRRRSSQSHPWSAVVAAAATSVVGFVVLVESRISMLRQFGVVLGGSLALALLAAWVVVTFDGRRETAPAGEQQAVAVPAPGAGGHRSREEVST